MLIRPANESEAAELGALVIGAKQHWGYSDEQMAAWQPALEISAELLAAHPAFVAELYGRVVGFYSLRLSGATCELENLWVLPAFMSRGIGRELLAHAGHTAASAGATVIAIDADPNSESFYLACGARRVGVVAAQIPGFADRVRPQLILAVAQSGIAELPDDR